MQLDAKLVEKQSKAGNPYTVLQIDIGMGCMKDVFLTDCEKTLLALQQKADSVVL